MTHQRPTGNRRPSQPPRRKHAPEIYMRRRVLALVLLLLVVALIIWGMVAFAKAVGGSGKDENPEATETVATATEDAPVTEPTVPEPSDAPASSPSSSAPPSEEEEREDTATAAAPENPGECSLKDLRITAMTNQPSYPAGTEPVLYMEVENPTEVDCVIDLEASPLRFEVYSMGTNDRIWSDTDCNQPMLTGSETFAPRETRGFEARWSATNSAPDACENRAPVPAGSYFLHAVIGDNASDPVPFNIT